MWGRLKLSDYSRHDFAFLSALIFSLIIYLPSFSQQVAIDIGRTESGVKVEKDDLHYLKLVFSYERIVTSGIETKKGLFSELSIPGAYWVGELGFPQLPASKKLIQIPFGSDVTVNVLKYDVSEYKLSEYGIEHKIMPVQPSVRKDQDIESLPFRFSESFYGKDSFIEHDIATVEILGVLRGYRIARLTIAPVSYNPERGIIRVYNDIEVELTFSNVDLELNRFVKASTWSPYFEPISNSFLNNPETSYPSHEDLSFHPVKYLVVSDRMFENNLQSFVNWKTNKGFRMIVAYTDEIGNTEDAIKNWVHGQYNTATPEDPAPSFLLLVGDTPIIPAAIGSATGKVTDLNYASVDGDFFPEMFFGRFSANNPAELIPQIEKTLYYEQYLFSDPSFLDKTTLIAGADSYWNPRVGQPTLIYGRDNYFNSGYGYTDVFTYLTSPYSGCYDAEKIAVGFINYTAHGSQTSWDNPMLTRTMINNFTNHGQYPLAIGNCCLTADFAHPESIGEAMVRASGKGAVAYIGSAPNTYWFEDFYWSVGAFAIQGNNNGYVPTTEETTRGAYDAPFVSDYVSTGTMVFIGNLAVTEAHLSGYPGHSSPKYYWQAYNVLGDPSLIVYHTQGNINLVNHQPVFPLGLSFYEIEAEPGSYIAISKAGQLLGTALVDSTGTAEVPVQPVNTAGMVDIVVTRPQYIPYHSSIPVAAIDGAYVVLNQAVINDLYGNNNGLADYSEDINLHITLKNIGSDPTGAVSATLIGTDDYITLTSTAGLNFGILDSWEITTIENAYSFSINDYVPDQHKATFVLEITDSNNTWEATLVINLHAPVLNLSTSFDIDDSQTGNNNGILDPGEIALFLYSITNAGHSDISDVEITAVSNDEMLVLNTESIIVDNLPAGETTVIAFSVLAKSYAPTAYPVYLDFIADGGPQKLYTSSQQIMLVIGPVPGYTMANETVTTCVGMFYDSGGPNINYQNKENLIMTFFPANPDAMIMANFLEFETEQDFDKLHIYNGSGTTAPEFPGSPFHGVSSPGNVIANNSDGAITFRFISDGSLTRQGWQAEITCHIPTGPPPCAYDPVPLNEASFVMTTSELTWSSEDASIFDVYFGTSINPPFVTTTNSNSFSAIMVPNTTYYWKIIPRNAFGYAENCLVWSFATGDPVYLMDNNSVTVSHGVFYDSGGPEQDYGNNEEHTIIFHPCADGYQLEFTFISFETETYHDLLYVYDGPNLDSPMVTGSPFHGTTNPGTVTSTHSSGALTFRFISNGTYSGSGWAASFICAGPLGTCVSAIPASLCEGNPAQLYANAIGGTGNYSYNWEPLFGLNDPQVPNPLATPDISTLYTVIVNDGSNSTSGSQNIVVYPVPVIDLGNDTIMCASHGVALDATSADAVSYYWLPGGETTPVITADSSGIGIGTQTYIVFVTDINGCVAEASVTITFDACTFVTDNQSELSILVYPNPAQSILNISISGYTGDFSFTLLNHHGQTVHSIEAGNVNGRSTHQINTRDFSSGLYYLRLNTRNNILTNKVIIY